MKYLTVVMSFLLAVLVMPIADAQAQGIGTLTGRDAIGLTKSDVKLQSEAAQAVLESQQVGETRTWENPETGLAGTVELTETFEMNGMTCGQVQNTYTAGSGKGRKFTAPMCKTADGTWKFAF